MLSQIIAIWSLQSISTNAYTTSGSGKATYYGGNDSGGACGYEDVPEDTFPFHYYAAGGGGSSYPFLDGTGCGLCFEITCIGPYDSSNTGCSCSSSTPSVTVQIMDQCPECDSDHFDLNPDAMERIVGDGLAGTCGVIEIEYKQVDCEYTSDFVIRTKSGTSQWWLGLHVDDVADVGAVETVTLSNNGDTVSTCQKNDVSFFSCSTPNGDLPLDVTLTDIEGNTVTAGECMTSYDGSTEFQCNTNFGKGDTASGSSSSSSSSGSSSGSTSGDVTVENKDGINVWWYAVWITDSSGDYLTSSDLDSVKITDDEGNSKEASYSSDKYWYAQRSSGQWYTPLTIKLTSSDGNTATVTISNVNEGTSQSTEWSSSYTEDGDSDGSNKLSFAAWFGIILCILLVIGCIIFGVFFMIKRRKQKGQVSFNDKYQIGDTPEPVEKETKDETVTNEEEIAKVEEIEVETQEIGDIVVETQAIEIESR